MDKSQTPQVSHVDHQVQDKRAKGQSQPFSYFRYQFDYFENLRKRKEREGGSHSNPGGGIEQNLKSKEEGSSHDNPGGGIGQNLRKRKEEDSTHNNRGGGTEQNSRKSKEGSSHDNPGGGSSSSSSRTCKGRSNSV